MYIITHEQVFTSDGVEVGVVVGVVESLRPSENRKSKSSEAESSARRNQSRKNQNVSISSDSVYDSVAYDPVKTTLSESETEAEEPTNHKARYRAL